MTTEILMPQLSPTMETGKLAKWHVKEGDEVRSGDIIAEIETDKATMEVEAVDEGRIGKLLVPEGTDHVPVNQPIAILLEDGEGEGASSFETRPVAAPQDEEERPHPEEGAAAPVAKGETEQVMHRIAEQIRANGANGHGARIFASPLARRLARERGIDLAALSGSGPHGRVVKADVERAQLASSRAEPQRIEAEIVEAEPLAAETIEEAAESAAPRARGPREIAMWHEEPEALSDANGARALRARLLRARPA